MKWKKPNPKKSKAQAMVEFAIALPVLLLLLYGIIEVGRWLFIYSSVVTASRQAVRYGSATGVGTSTTVPRYDDCDGIRAAAQHVGFLGAFDTVEIKYDSGPNTSDSPIDCSGPTSTFAPSGGNNSRIKVKVTKQFTPLVKLLPFTPQTISASSARTILLSVAIEVTAPPVTFVASTPTDTPSPTPTGTDTATATNTPTATDTPIYTYTPSKTPTRTLTPTVTRTPTITPTFTQAPTTVPSCTAVTHGPITKTGNTMSITITNNEPFPLTFNDVTVTWNDDKGHQTGGDKTLKLQSASLGGTVFWSGSISGQSTYTIDASPIIPAGPGTTVTLTFSFHQSYDNFDGTENIYINLLTPGCEGDPIHS